MLRPYLIVAPALLTLIGCGGGGGVAPVSGVITLDGKPTADIAVTFQPVAESSTKTPPPTAVGVTDKDGRYTLKVLDGDRKGASVGKNLVRICPYAVGDSDDPNRPKAKLKLPARYYDQPAEFDVPAGGSNSANSDLKSK